MNDAEHEALLLAVFKHYGLREPGYGERAIKCPVHDEDHPSCSVNRGKGLWHCHACGAGGGGVQIVMEREGCGFRDAMRLIEKWGIDVSRSEYRNVGRNKRGTRWQPRRAKEAV